MKSSYISTFRGLKIPTGVSLNTSSASIGNGQTYQLIANISPNDASNKKLHRSSSNTSRALVDNNGLVTGIGDGTVIITVTTDVGGYTDTCTFSIYTINVTGISLNETNIILCPGETTQLIATITPNDATNKKITWTSSDINVASVDNNGFVTYVGNGECIISATTVDGGYTASCTVVGQRLPIEYQEVEYIQSNGSQYINTGLTLSPNITFDFQFQLTRTDNEQGIIGARGSSNAYRHSLMTYNSMFHFMVGNGSGWNGSVDTNKHTVSLTGGGSSRNINADGVDYSVNQSVSSNTSNPYYIFRNGSQNTSYVKMFYSKFYNSNTLVRDFIPCYRKSDQVIGMYDFTNSVFYTNAGSGTFTKGPNV